MGTKPKIIRNTPEEEAEIQAGIDRDPDNPEWTDEDFKNAPRVDISWLRAAAPRTFLKDE